ALSGLGLADLREPVEDDDEPSAGWTVALHPLVRDTNLTHSDVTTNPTFPTLAIQLVAAATQSDTVGLPDDPQMWPWWQALTPHATHLVHLAAYDHRLSADTVAAACDAADLAAWYLRSRGLYRQAHTEFEQLYAIHRRMLGEEHPDTLAARHGVAFMLGDMGEWTRARTEYEQLLDIHRRMLGEEHPDT